MLYMTVWAIKHRTFVNNFAYETAEINIEVKHLLENYKAARATSRFLGKANILLSIGLGAIESAEYAYQGKSCHALWNGIVSVGAISTGLLLGPGITTVTAMIALSIGIALVASAFSFIGNNILDSME